MKQKPKGRAARPTEPKSEAKAPRAGSARIALPVVAGEEPKEARFACRECPARCCRMPWQIRFDEATAARYREEAFVAERVGAAGLAVIAKGMLPTRVEAGGLQCAFLDDDDLCSLQKRFGHAYLPGPCQAFPFGFVDDESGTSLAQLSLLCPSIRDDRGEPVAGVLPAKLVESGGAARMTHRMATLSGVMLTRPQFLTIAEHWSARLGATDDVGAALAGLVDFTHALEAGLEGGEYVADATLEKALSAAADAPSTPFVRGRASSYRARLFFAFTLGNLAYPSRLRQENRVDPPIPLEGLRALGNKLAFLLERGSVDLLLLPKDVPLGGVRRVPRILGGGPLSAIVRDYLRLVLARRQVFAPPRKLLAVLLDLCLGAALIGRFARCSALANGREEATEADVREGIGIAELLVLNHSAAVEQPRYVERLRWGLMTSAGELAALIGSEA